MKIKIWDFWVNTLIKSLHHYIITYLICTISLNEETFFTLILNLIIHIPMPSLFKPSLFSLYAYSSCIINWRIRYILCFLWHCMCNLSKWNIIWSHKSLSLKSDVIEYLENVLAIEWLIKQYLLYWLEWVYNKPQYIMNNMKIK